MPVSESIQVQVTHHVFGGEFVRIRTEDEAAGKWEYKHGLHSLEPNCYHGSSESLELSSSEFWYLMVRDELLLHEMSASTVKLS